MWRLPLLPFVQVPPAAKRQLIARKQDTIGALRIASVTTARLAVLLYPSVLTGKTMIWMA